MIAQALVRIIRDQFALDWHGIHGVPHWTRVRDNGLRLAKVNGANQRVVELFAFLHDSRRVTDGHDPEHGPRAALYARALVGSAFELDPFDLDLLVTACHGHSDGLTEGDLTVLTCWDADRLDLGRVGIKPHPDRLCTEAAREEWVLEWAYRRSLGRPGR
jgi:uncharacterized protein